MDFWTVVGAVVVANVISGFLAGTARLFFSGIAALVNK